MMWRHVTTRHRHHDEGPHALIRVDAEGTSDRELQYQLTRALACGAARVTIDARDLRLPTPEAVSRLDLLTHRAELAGLSVEMWLPESV